MPIFARLKVFTTVFTIAEISSGREAPFVSQRTRSFAPAFCGAQSIECVIWVFLVSVKEMFRVEKHRFVAVAKKTNAVVNHLEIILRRHLQNLFGLRNAAFPTTETNCVFDKESRFNALSSSVKLFLCRVEPKATR